MFFAVVFRTDEDELDLLVWCFAFGLKEACLGRTYELALL